MANVRDIIRTKNSVEIWSILPEASVYEALKLMREKNIGALLVMRGPKIEGIISERDCIRKVDLEGRTSKNTQVREIMTSQVLYVDINQSLEECMAIMSEKNIRHLPVFENQRLVGIISVKDVMKEIVSDQRFMIDQLSRYITGSGR